ncbi:MULTISPECIES: hypothetical protein [Planktothrix]|jgi:hypothetical protein|uniref:Uncharacterized protein n=5 Tax=Planktothrix TaxID=54304 RepID=A0A073CLL1_PLAA1|nr:MULTISPECIES: hypothetical protein [Planktothrix]KEI69194.1 hypothetical protein A19Y_4557 [Planktothrix agardhii NIVA-CYA 126/8]MCF3605245.1 hypothetical protein [Planktothrix agardhii 1033]CAD5931343.1 hypothetical protein NO108_01691 [Planktothrix rubescens]BBD54080.1 hypothetical protein NIES204_13680 [Planktothrix agardhii NIES-204]GDZ93472.1 hypothetical protein PA905_13110 [Planktothrix agardhii CCAP 1459/11A]
MSNQLLMPTRSSTVSGTQTLDAPLSRTSGSVMSKPLTIDTMKNLYNTDQQVKFLHLHAEVETLLLELQTIKQQRQETASPVN